MKNYLLLLLLFGSLISSVNGQSKKKNYEYTVDLTEVVDDKVRVELVPPDISSSEVTFFLPKIIPGTYAIADYGRFVSDFKALDKKGRQLPVEHPNDNTWKIKNAGKLRRITYWVNDTYDTTLKELAIFQPAGTNIEDHKNFVINSSGFFGYFENMKETPVTLNVVRPQDFYGSTGLIPQKTGETITKLKLEKGSDPNIKKVDTFVAEDYDQLVDSPLMYSKPDTAIIHVGNTEVLIGCYSPTQKVNAKEIASSV